MPSWLTKTLQFFVILLIPILITLTAVRFLTTDQYVAFEYGKANFPPDTYGFDNQLRFILASTNIHYVLQHLPLDELSKQTLAGIPVYTAREVSHMVDVRTVFQSILRFWWIAFLMILLSGIILWSKEQRLNLASAIQTGGLLTIGLIFMIGLLAVFAWQFWFETFHLFFFQPGSWLFSYSDTLIRLFPVEFWFDATITISILSLIGGAFVTLIGWRSSRAIEKATKELNFVA